MRWILLALYLLAGVSPAVHVIEYVDGDIRPRHIITATVCGITWPAFMGCAVVIMAIDGIRKLVPTSRRNT